MPPLSWLLPPPTPQRGGGEAGLAVPLRVRELLQTGKGGANCRHEVGIQGGGAVLGDVDHAIIFLPVLLRHSSWERGVRAMGVQASHAFAVSQYGASPTELDE